MFSLMTAGMAVIMERKNGTLRRLMTTRLRRWELIAGKMAGMFVLTFMQQILLVGVGQLIPGLAERSRVDLVDRDGRVAVDPPQVWAVHALELGQAGRAIGSALDLADVAPMTQPYPLVNVMRPDVVRPGLDRDEVLAQAPAAEDGRFRVPPVIGLEG